MFFNRQHKNKKAVFFYPWAKIILWNSEKQNHISQRLQKGGTFKWVRKTCSKSGIWLVSSIRLMCLSLILSFETFVRIWYFCSFIFFCFYYCQFSNIAHCKCIYICIIKYQNLEKDNKTWSTGKWNTASNYTLWITGSNDREV